MNNRKILYGIAQTIGHADKMIDITVAIDKLDKIGIDNVKCELRERGIGDEAIAALEPILELSGDNNAKLACLREIIGSSETGMAGVEEMQTIFDHAERLGIGLPIELDLSLARGLNYYTGAIFEVKANDFQIGSICGGGRYDDLTGIFGMPGMSGVGISFGADRIYDVMAGLGLFPDEVDCSTRVMFRQSRRGGAGRIARTAGRVARRRHRCRDIPRQRQDEKADGVCQSPRDTAGGHHRIAGAGRARGDTQRHALGRTAQGAVRPSRRNPRRLMKRALCIALCVLSLTESSAALEQPKSVKKRDIEQIQKLNVVYRQLLDKYVDEISLDSLVEHAIVGTLSQLDPHSVYLTADEMKAARESLENRFVGIGVRCRMLRDTLIVFGTTDGSPAQKGRYRNGRPNRRSRRQIARRPIIGAGGGAPARQTRLEGKTQHRPW